MEHWGFSQRGTSFALSLPVYESRKISSSISKQTTDVGIEEYLYDCSPVLGSNHSNSK